jgi:hypothetical protein
MLTLTLLNQTFTIHRLEANTKIPESVLHSSFFFVTHTDEELSLVLPDTVQLESDRSDPGWACFKVQGPLDFNLVGVLAGISSVLAEAKIAIFALSTFDTDYILVKREQEWAARDALSSAGYRIRQDK